jgi:hypothetical protein
MGDLHIMKATSNIKAAPPMCGVGGGQYSRDLSSHAYSPVIFRKSKVKRDTQSQFLLCSTCSNEVKLHERQSNRVLLHGSAGEVPNAMGKPRTKTVLNQVRWNNYVHSKIKVVKKPTLTGDVASMALARIQEVKDAKEAQEQAILANKRTTKHLSIKSKNSQIACGKFNIAQAFTGL